LRLLPTRWLGLLTANSADGTLRVAASKVAPFYFGPATDAAFTLNADIFDFDPGAAVDTDTEIITMAGHGLATGEAVVYSNGGGTDIGSLVDGTTYFAIVIDENTIQLAATEADAEAETPVFIDLTSAGSGSEHTFGRTVMLKVDEALTNRFIYDLVNDMNRSFNDTFHGASANPFEAGFDGQRLVITAKDGFGITDFSITADETDSAVTDLKLYNIGSDLTGPQTVVADNANLLIFTQDGAVHQVYLDDDDTLFSRDVGGGVYVANDLQEVKVAIETITSSDVTVALNPSQTGLDLEDHTSAADPPVPIFRIDSVNASRAAFALGIRAADLNLMLADITVETVPFDSNEVNHVIEGDRIGTLDLEDRLFLRQVDADTELLNAGIYVGVDVEEVSASFGFVGVELATPFTQYLLFEVGVELNEDGDPLENVTLARLFDAISLDVNRDGVLDLFDLNEVLTFPTMTVDDTLDELAFDVKLQAGIEGIIDLPGSAQITLQVLDAGDPFNMLPGAEPFDGSDGLIVDIDTDTINLAGHGFKTLDKVAYCDGDGSPIGGLQDNESYYIIKIDENTI